MYVLNLDSLFQPFGSSINFETSTFSGGELHIRLNLEQPLNSNLVNTLMITCRPKSFNDLGLIALATDAARRLGFNEISLFMPYFPGARQDRVVNLGEPLTAKVNADFLNQLNFKKILIVDPHSDVTSALLNNVKIINNHAFVGQCLSNHNTYTLVSPDAGSLKKANRLANYLGLSQIIEASKQRDTRTGKLKNFKVYAKDLNKHAKALKAINAGNLILIATHGIFRNGFTALKEYYSHIYCSNTYRDIKEQGVHQIKFEGSLLE